MKIAFFTEMGFTGKTPRNHPNMRTEFAWFCALDADHHSIGSFTRELYDIGIIILPKKNLDKISDLEILNRKQHCKKIAIMQEGPHTYFQDYPIELQIKYLNFLNQCDLILCHNNQDINYYEGLTNKPAYTMPSLMIEDTIKNIQSVERKNVMIGGNFCSWYGGLDSYMVARNLDEPIFVPSMGRKIENEEAVKGLTHLPYMNWAEWIHKLNEFKYGIHLMRTQAAGTFALNCAYLGIPCIGYAGLDTQESLHQHTTISKFGDLVTANHFAKRLKEDKGFYKLCSEKARESYERYWREDYFKKLMLTTFKNLLNVS